MKKIILVFIFIMTFSINVSAQVDVEKEQSDMLGVDELKDSLPNDAAELLDGVSVTDSLDFQESIKKILDSGLAQSGTALKKGFANAALLIVIVFLCSFVSSVHDSTASKSSPKYVTVAAALAITSASAGSLNSFIGIGAKTIDELMLFSKALLPTLTAATVAMGAPATSAAINVASALFSDILITLINVAVLPMVYLYIVACTANAAIGDDSLSRVASMIKWFITTSLKVILVVFTAYLTISGLISGSADAVTVRAAKLAISGSVPVVGSIIADASETMLVSMGVLKNSVGVFGMLGVLAICVTPFIQIGASYLIYKLAAAIAATIADGTVVKLIDCIGSAMGILLGMTGSCALMISISCVAAVRVVTG